MMYPLVAGCGAGMWAEPRPSEKIRRPYKVVPASATVIEIIDRDALLDDVDLLDPLHTVTDGDVPECVDDCPGCAADRLRAALRGDEATS